MKRWFLIGVMVLLVIPLLSGCGIPQEDYDAVVADKEAVETKIPALESDLSKEKSEVSNTKREITSVKSELAIVTSDLKAAQGERDEAESQASSLKSQVSSAQSAANKAKSELAAKEATIAEREAKISELEAAAAKKAAEAAAEEKEEAVEEIPPLFIGGIQFCSAVSAGGDCKYQPKATFDRGDTVYLYFQTGDFYTKTRPDGRYEIWLVFRGSIYGPGGEEIPSFIFFQAHDTDLEYQQLYYWAWIRHNSKADDEPGQYRFEFTVTDMLSGAKGKGSAIFTLE